MTFCHSWCLVSASMTCLSCVTRLIRYHCTWQRERDLRRLCSLLAHRSRSRQSLMRWHFCQVRCLHYQLCRAFALHAALVWLCFTWQLSLCSFPWSIGIQSELRRGRKIVVAHAFAVTIQYFAARASFWPNSRDNLLKKSIKHLWLKELVLYHGETRIVLMRNQSRPLDNRGRQRLFKKCP